MSEPGAIAGLERLRRRARRRAVLGGVLAWLVACLPLTAVAIRLAGQAALGGGAVALMISGAWLATLVALAHRWAWRPWRRLADRRAFALRVDRQAGCGNLVVAAEEAAREPARWPAADPVARELGRRLGEGAAAAVGKVGPGDLVPLRRLRAGLALLAAGAVMSALLLAGDPAAAARGAALLVAPLAGRDGGEAPLVAEPGVAWVAAGGTVALAALDHATEAARTFAEIRFGDGAWTRIAAEAGQAPPVAAGTGTGGPRRRWQASVPDVREDFSWRFRRGSFASGVTRVEVRHPPLLSMLSAVVEPPAYTGLPDREVERLPAVVEVPVGSTVRLRGESSQELGAAWLDRPGGDELAMVVEGRTARASLEVVRDEAFSVRLRDRHGLESPAPLGYRLAVLEDSPPAVTLSRPGDDGLLPLDGHVSLLVTAGDDYGLRSLELRAGTGAADGAAALIIGPRVRGDEARLPTAAGEIGVRVREVDGHAPPLAAALALELDAGGLELAPGEALTLVVEARDNRAPGPGQPALSATLRLALPSAADVLASQAEAAGEGRAELEEARRRGRELDADLERLARELLKNPVADWARRQEIEAAIERQQALQRELARTAAGLQEQMERLASGQLTSERQLERAGELAELLQQSQSPELAALLERLAKGESPVAPEDVARALEQVARGQKDLERRLDAALALMQRMEDEQRLEGLSSLLEDLMRRQQELADRSARLDESRPDGQPGGQEADPEAGELASRQEALAQDLAQLEQKLEEALAAMEERRREAQAKGGEGQEGGEKKGETQQGETGDEGGQEDPAGDRKGGDEGRREAAEKALREALEKLREQQANGSMGRASQMLQQMDPGQAAQMQQQALRDLGSLYSVLAASKQAMQAAMKMEQVSSLRGLAADLLALSRRQEELGARIPVQLQDVRNLELTRQQHRLQKAALGARDRLALLLEEAPNRILKLLEKLDGLVEGMGGAVRALEEGRAAAARDEAGRSLAEANRIVIGLLTEAQMAGGGGGGGSQQPSAGEQLQELARRQAELNGATEELRRMLADRGISQETRSRMQRLGQQQAQLGQDLGRVAEEERERPQGQGERLLGDLQELGRQMERVGGDLGDGQVDQGVLQRQDRILGRLLDARNAARQRDWSTRRESRAAARLFDAQAPGGADGRDAAGPAARERRQRLEDAPLEYRDLVRRYFAAIDSLRGAAGDLP